MSDTRSIWLSAGADRNSASNEQTQVVSLHELAVLDPGPSRRTGSIALPDASFQEVFLRNYARIRVAVARRNEAGVAVVAASGQDVHGDLWLSAAEGLRTAIVGRHGRADLFVPNDPGLSLRHAAVLVDRVSERTRIRVMDLRSEAGLRDERDRAFGAVEADGPLLLTASRLRLFLIPTPVSTPWPDDPAAGWEALPARHFLDEQPVQARPAVEYEGARAVVLPRVRDERREVTIVSSLGPIGAQFRSLVEPGEQPLGKLTLTSFTEAELTIGPAAAARGILLGRYDRCDAAGLSPMRDHSVSRVHALIVEAGGELRLIDTASTNGTTRVGQRVRCERLVPGEEFRLGTLRLRWDPAS